MVSQVAWLSFDQTQQQRTQLFLNALSDQGTVDELGTGIIRDLISNVLFPGHTVLHTRAADFQYSIIEGMSART